MRIMLRMRMMISMIMIEVKDGISLFRIINPIIIIIMMMMIRQVEVEFSQFRVLKWHTHHQAFCICIENTLSFLQSKGFQIVFYLHRRPLGEATESHKNPSPNDLHRYRTHANTSIHTLSHTDFGKLCSGGRVEGVQPPTPTQ